MKEYEVKRIAREVVSLLLDDDRFANLIERRRGNQGMINSAMAAEILGISKYTLRHIAPYIGGVKKGTDRRQHWCFEKETLVDNYKRYIGTL